MEEKGQNCGNCLYMHEDAVPDPSAVSGMGKAFFCRRYPKQVFAFPMPGHVSGTMTINVQSTHPAVTESEWCGDWESIEDPDED
jgi:hypothetical protein